MNTPLILDASALLAVTLLEPGGDFILARIQAAESAMIHATNVFEVAYKLMFRGIPEEIAWKSATYGAVTVVEDMSEPIAKRAVGIKMTGLHLSMADCFCLALTEMVGGRVLTSDKGFAAAKTSAEVVLFR